MYNTVVQKKFNLCYLVTELVIVAQKIVNYCMYRYLKTKPKLIN